VKPELQALARSLGFHALAVTTADPPPHAEAFRRWLADGFHADMAWMERNAARRADPDLVLPGARSVLLLATSYFHGDSPRPTPLPGRVARYAWGDDYHDLLAPRLAALDAWLTGHGGTQRCYVDTGPVLERDLAARAGLGWQAKSTMLLREDLGTWFFLSAILTTLELPPDPVARDRCGRCTRCIDACPTGAIVAPYQLDARRCISYLTIENKGPIPEPLRPGVGDRIFGCDDCLEACPWNRFAQASAETAFALREPLRSTPLRDLLALDDAAFREAFRGSPILRTKRRGFLRNVCVALGNTGSADDLPALRQAALDPEPLIAEHAAWAIRQITAASPPR
jgi:epoxyqueuosine reductase